ncbi:FHA domain-containing protein [Chloroflexota bacterium]
MTSFLIWFYNGLGGLGGWILFFLLGLAGIVLIFIHSASRQIPATIWKVLVLVAFLFIFPVLIYRISGQEVRSTFKNFTDEFFYLGLMAGIIPAFLGLGYLAFFSNMVACGNGHFYDIRLGKCPECPAELILDDSFIPGGTGSDYSDSYTSGEAEYSDSYTTGGAGYPETDYSGGSASFKPGKKRVPAWLVGEGNRVHQLFVDETTIGKMSANDIKLNDGTVSRRHAKIEHENGHYRLYDLGSKNYTRLNGRIIRKPMLLVTDDELQFGDNSKFIFKC